MQMSSWQKLLQLFNTTLRPYVVISTQVVAQEQKGQDCKANFVYDEKYALINAIIKPMITDLFQESMEHCIDTKKCMNWYSKLSKLSEDISEQDFKHSSQLDSVQYQSVKYLTLFMDCLHEIVRDVARNQITPPRHPTRTDPVKCVACGETMMHGTEYRYCCTTYCPSQLE